MKNWVLVADSRRARVFSTDGSRSELVEVADFTHPRGVQAGDNPQGHIHAGDSGTRHGLARPSTPKDRERHGFAMELAEFLEHEFAQRNFAGLTLIAPPEFLGELRAALPQGVSAAVGGSIAKDLLACSAAELSRHLGTRPM